VRARHQLKPLICAACGFAMLQRDTETDRRNDADPRALQARPRRVRSCPREASRARAVRHLGLLGGLLRPGVRYLEVGCGEGALLAGAAARGAHATGIELSEADCALARTQSDANVICAAFEEVAFGEPFDVIACSHALEHARDPLAWLRRMRELLKPEGVLFVAVPNVMRPHGSIKRAFQRQHLYYFSPSTLPLALATTGFAPWHMRVYAHEDLTILARTGEFTVSPDPAHADEVIAALRRHAVDYYRTLMSVWRGLPPLRNALFYGRWTDHFLWARQGPEADPSAVVQPGGLTE